MKDQINILIVCFLVYLLFGCSKSYEENKEKLDVSCEKAILQIGRNYSKEATQKEYDGPPRLIFALKFSNSMEKDTVVKTPQIEQNIPYSEGYFSLEKSENEIFNLYASNTNIEIRSGESCIILFYLSYSEFEQSKIDYISNTNYYKEYLLKLAKTGNIIYHSQNGIRYPIIFKDRIVAETHESFFDLTEILRSSFN